MSIIRKVLDALRDDMLHPNVVSADVREFHESRRRRSQQVSQQRTKLERRHRDAAAKVERLVNAIADGGDEFCEALVGGDDDGDATQNCNDWCADQFLECPGSRRMVNVCMGDNNVAYVLTLDRSSNGLDMAFVVGSRIDHRDRTCANDISVGAVICERRGIVTDDTAN